MPMTWVEFGYSLMKATLAMMFFFALIIVYSLWVRWGEWEPKNQLENWRQKQRDEDDKVRMEIERDLELLFPTKTGKKTEKIEPTPAAKIEDSSVEDGGKRVFKPTLEP
jgi:hypothetical protein